MTRPTPFSLATFAFALLATAACADEGGTLTGTIGAQAVTLKLWADQSDHWGEPSYGGVSIYANSRDEGLTGTFSLSFEMYTTGTAVPEIRWRRSGDTGTFYGEDDTGATVTLNTSEVQGDLLHLVGTATGTLAYTTDYGRTLDMTNTLPVSLDFDLLVGPEE